MLPFSPDPDANLVARRSLAAALALSDALREDVAKALAGLPSTTGPDEVLAAARLALEAHAEPLAHFLADAQLAAWLRGAGGVAAQLPELIEAAPSIFQVQAPALPVRSAPTVSGRRGTPPPPPAPPTSPDGPHWDWDGSPAWLPLVAAAVRDLRGRRLVTKPEWERLSAAARERAFTAAGLATEEAIGSVRDALAEAVDRGHGFPEFKDQVDQALGTSTLGTGRLANVFRTGAGKAYANGAHELGQSPLVRDMFPYRERLIIADSRITDLCATLARSGIQRTAIYRADDPAWLHFRPLSHWQCRCSVRMMTVADAAARDITSARRWLETGEDPHDFVVMPDVELPKGWLPGGS